jgi:hypothetical protein
MRASSDVYAGLHARSAAWFAGRVLACCGDVQEAFCAVPKASVLFYSYFEAAANHGEIMTQGVVVERNTRRSWRIASDGAYETTARGQDVLKIPLLSKGTAFPFAEREAF